MANIVIVWFGGLTNSQSNIFSYETLKLPRLLQLAVGHMFMMGNALGKRCCRSLRVVNLTKSIMSQGRTYVN